MVRYTHFWDMAHAVRGYCKVTGLSVISRDDNDDLTLGFVTDCPRLDTRFREWRIRITDAIQTGNHRPPSFGDFTDANMIKMTHPYLQDSKGRHVLAEILSSGRLPLEPYRENAAPVVSSEPAHDEGNPNCPCHGCDDSYLYTEK